MPDIRVDIEKWLQMCKDIGFAEGLLMGWLHSDPANTKRAKEATERFLAREKNDG